MTRGGLFNLDPTRKGFGYGVNGVMTRFVRVPARIVHRLPDGSGFEQACLTERCCVAYSAVVKKRHRTERDVSPPTDCQALAGG
jgi:L-iditol 2-dehydrogenase